MKKALLPGRVERGRVRIISISSTIFHAGTPRQTHYAASKGALIGFTCSLAAEVGDLGVTVNSIAPGLVRTPTTAAGRERQLLAPVSQTQAIRRTGEPADLVGACLCLASDDAAFTTGQTITVDGGFVRP